MEKLEQIVYMETIGDSLEQHRLVAMTSPDGFFVYVETLDEDTDIWEQDNSFTQWQLWESDTPDYMSARDIAKDQDCLDFFAGQGLKLSNDL